MRRTDDRSAEHERRRLALALCKQLGDTPAARRRVAEAFGKTERTLRRWAAQERAQRPLPRLGRPPTAVPRERRQSLIGQMLRLGPYAGVAALRALVEVPYRAIAALKRRFARAIQRRRGWYRRSLAWLEPGSVWATDFTRAEAELDDGDDRLLLVRDLASGAQLAAVPCKSESAGVVCAVLTMLFVLLGAPLVVKHDNGGAFTAHSTRKTLHDHGAVALCSPPYTPQYNGAIERGGGCLKARVAHVAWARGDPERWSERDLALALHLANTTARPRGANGPTPAEAFAARRPIGPRERRAFQRTRARAIAHALKTREAERGTMPTCAERAGILRRATQHALCKHGYLDFRRGRISTPISTWRAVSEA